MSTFKAGDRVIYNGKKFKIDYVRDNGTAKIHSIQGKVNEIIYYADVNKMKSEDKNYEQRNY